jgi:hypothetical protein
MGSTLIMKVKIITPFAYLATEAYSVKIVIIKALAQVVMITLLL